VGVKLGLLHIKEKHRLRIFENSILRRLLRRKREEMTGGWRRLHNEELHKLYASSNIIRVNKLRRMKWAGHVACMRQNYFCRKS
jgi:hypothetical protein